MSELADRVDALADRARTRRREQRAVMVAEADARAVNAEQVRSELRETMPVVAGVVDQFRTAFGDGVRVLAAQENGKTVVNRRACERFGIDVSRYETAER